MKRRAIDEEDHEGLRSLIKEILEKKDRRLNAKILKYVKDFISTMKIEEPLVNPKHLLCPISNQLMKDPVILPTGQTYDRSSIEAWFNSGKRTCPKTHQVLDNPILFPNDLVHSMIPKQEINPPLFGDCKKQQVVKQNNLNSVLCTTSSTSSCIIPEGKKSLAEDPDSNFQLLPLISVVPSLDYDPGIQLSVVITIADLSTVKSNKQIIGNIPQAISLLINALKAENMGCCRMSALALFNLSSLDSNKVKIGELGAMRPLVELMEKDNTKIVQCACVAISSLCMTPENKERAVKAGVVSASLKAIRVEKALNELLDVLILLKSHREALDAMCKNKEWVHCLLNIISRHVDGHREKAAVILFSISMHDEMTLEEIFKEGGLIVTVYQLAQDGTPRSRRKALGILEMIHETIRRRR